MCKQARLNFPTLVLVLFFARHAGALPTDPSPDFTAKPADRAPLPESESKRELIEITRPPPGPKSVNVNRPQAEYFYKFHHELGLQLGILKDTESRGTEGTLHKTISVRYTFPDHKLQAWEWNGTFITDGTGTLSFSRKFIASQDRFRPYSSIGIGNHIIADQALASFLLWRQYQLRAAVGFAWTQRIFAEDAHWRIEVAGAAGSRSQQLDGSVGYVWPW